MHMCGVIVFAEMMVVVGVQLHLKLFASAHERINVLHRMLHVHVVIAGTVNNQYVACEICRFVKQRRLFIAARIHLRATHVAFGIGRIV